ncbi:outer membrane beta-barrel protein [bacterium]|nr:outer membrane beta-barrel protein [bacterium]
MKKRTVITAILLCVVPFALVNAQRAAGHFSIAGFAGAGLPMGPEAFKDNFGMGMGFGGGLKFNVTEKTSLAVSFIAQKLMLDDDKILDDYGAGSDDTIEGGDVNINVISANLVQYVTPPDAFLGFYLTAGGGYYMMSATDMKITQPGGGSLTVSTDAYDANNVGVNGGVGVEIGLGTLGFSIEGKFHYIFTENDATMIVTAMGGVIINL